MKGEQGQASGGRGPFPVRAPVSEQMPKAVYGMPQIGPSTFQQGPMARDDAIRKISEAIMLGQDRPIWGQDYLGPETGGEMDQVSYQASPYEQGRNMPPDIFSTMTPQQEDNYSGDQGYQDLTGMDPYGNPLPPSWAPSTPTQPVTLANEMQKILRKGAPYR